MRTDIGTADVAAAHLDAMMCQVIAKCLGRLIVGLLGDHDRLGDHQAAEIMAAERQLEMVNARRANLFGGRPHTGRSIAVGKTAHDPHHLIIHPIRRAWARKCQG